MKRRLTRLFGGHRNSVFRTNGFVKIVWKEGFKRKNQIREGVLLENFVAAHTEIKSRLLVDKSKPLQEEDGKLVTYFHYCEGEIRYPWNLAEIASAAKLLAKLHQIMNQSIIHHPSSIIHHLHLDFARGNVLFQPGTSNAIGVIDFETTSTGPIEQDLGRSLSFLLVDTPANYGRDDPLRSILQGSSLFERANVFLTNYPLPYRKEDALKWAIKYLADDDYGSLNNVRDKALSFISSSRANRQLADRDRSK